MYKINIQNGYIISLVSDVDIGNIGEEDYNNIKMVIDNRPTPPEGYDYRLKENLEWELYELPPVAEDLEE